MKNRPITARVKSGMFKTKEPLLNVGPAGVDGNNKTRTMPSPSKMKGYAMKSSPLKQVNQPTYRTDEDGNLQVVLKSQETTPGNAGSSGSSGQAGQDAIYDTGKSLRGLSQEQLDWRAKQIEELGGIDNYHKRYGDKTKGKKVKDAIPAIDPTPAVDATPGETENYEQVGDPMRQVIGEASTAYESRNNIRKGIQANRKVKKGDIKNARSKAKGGGYYKNDGTFVKASDNKGVGETRKAARIANRAQKKEDKEDLKGMESGKDKRTLRKQMNKDRKNTKKKAIQKAKDKVRGFKDEKSDAKARQNRANQEIAKQEAAGALEQATQRKTGYSGNQSVRTTDVLKTNADIGDAKAAEAGEKTLVSTTENPPGQPMKTNGFFKKKSPMKMNYFKK
tara:strand:+ start:493 stop:1668 length:1176 start_codon:yes stop_codon:yes gene_type:complete